jgi:CheY-like chemotaxis protein
MIPNHRSGASGGLVTTTLLAVDDSKTIRRVLEITFAGENYRTVLAESADEALNKARAERPAVALIDASLGATSGYELCQQIKREVPGIPVILLSSKQAPYDRARGSSVGADDFIDKPFDTQQLIEKVSAAARRAGEPARAVASPAAAASASVAPVGGFPGRQRTTTLAYGSAATDAHAAAGPATSQGIGPRTQTAPGPAAQPSNPPFGARPVPFTQPAGLAPPSPQAHPATSTGGTQPSFAAAPARGAHPEAPAPVPATTLTGTAPRAASAPALNAISTPDGQFAERLAGLGLTQDQTQAVLALSREVVERVVWEVVPVLAETLIKEELRRLTSD